MRVKVVNVLVKKTSKSSGLIKHVYDITGATISPDTEAILIKLSETSGLSLSDEENSIASLFDEAYETLLSKGVKQNIELLAINGVRNSVRKLTKKKEFEPKAKAEVVVGFIVGDSGLWDKMEQMRSAARRFVDKKGIQAAVKAELINEDNKVLDTRKKIFGKENTNYKKPLKEKERDSTRTLHLVARINGDKNYKYGSIQTNSHALALGWGKVRFFIPCQTYGIVKENPDEVNGFKLNSSQAEDTPSIFKAVKEDMDVDEIFMSTIGPDIIPIIGVERFHESYKDVYGAIIFVRGTVAWINRDRPSPFGDIKMGLMDENGEMVTVSIPEYLTTDFGENSDVVVIGRTLRQDLKEEGDDKQVRWIKGAGDVAIKAVGVYGVKGMTTPSDYNKPESLEDEKEIVGWVE